MIDHVERFLLELGQGFAFVGKQVHLEIGDADFYTDLLFFHLKLRCFVVIELKVGDFDPSYLGQLGTYMAAVDDLLRHADDKATIGLLLCKTKNNVVAEYALAVTPRPSALRSGRPPSPRACPPSSNPAFPQSKSSKPSWQMSPTWLPKLPSSRKRIVVALAHAEATDGDLARVLSGATGDEDANVGTDAQGPGDPERRQASAKAFEEVFGRRPSSATDWATAEVLNPNSYDPLYQGAKPEIRVARIEPVPGQGAVRVSQVH